MKTEILLFASQFAVVFLLGFQSQTVRDNRHACAFMTSSCIGAAQLFQWRVMPDASGLQMFVWWLAGPLAIVSAMLFYSRVFRKK